MQGPSDTDADRAEAPARLRPLLPPGDPITAAELVERMGMWRREPDPGALVAPAARPYVLLNMVSSADGRATLAGRSGELSSKADRELFHALRLASDGVLVGAGTVRAERYGRIVRDPGARRVRAERGLEPEPLACIVSGRLGLDPAIPLLAEPEARVALLTAAAGELEGAGAQISYIRGERGSQLDLTASLTELRERFGIRLLLCEGGPHLAADLVGHGLLDELLLSLSPSLAGGDPPDGQALRILAGVELQPSALELRGALAADSHLFLRYAVVAPERVSRETTSSSSAAR